MLPTRSDRLVLAGVGLLTALIALPPAPVAAAGASATITRSLEPAAIADQAAPQAPQKPASSAIVSSEVNLSREDAVLQLGFEGGRTVEFAIRDGRMFADGKDLGPVQPHGPGDRTWRSLLNRAMETPTPQLAGLLRGWAAPEADQPLKRAIVSMLAAPPSEAADQTPAVAPVPAGTGNSDTLAKLQTRLEAMQQRLEQMQQQRMQQRSTSHTNGWTGPFRQVWRGFIGTMGTLVMFAILLGIGVATVFFGGRPHLEAVADAARRYTARSWLVGLAASFLLLPVYILGALALTISLVGIPVLIAWLPLFPVVVIVATLLGYLGVAHAAGEAVAERRLYGGDWFSRGNSYYFLMTGLGLLLACFLAAHVIEMAGAWLGFLRGILMFVGVVATWFALTTGLGAVLLTRGGTRPITGLGPMDSDVASNFEEESRA